MTKYSTSEPKTQTLFVISLELLREVVILTFYLYIIICQVYSKLQSTPFLNSLNLLCFRHLASWFPSRKVCCRPELQNPRCSSICLSIWRGSFNLLVPACFFIDELKGVGGNLKASHDSLSCQSLYVFLSNTN